jgi:signal peptidase I
MDGNILFAVLAGILLAIQLSIAWGARRHIPTRVKPYLPWKLLLLFLTVFQLTLVRSLARGGEAGVALDDPWKVGALLLLLAQLRIIWGVWGGVPARRFVVELLDAALIAFLLVFLIVRPFVVQAFYIPSGSMTPTFLVGDRILVNKFIYHLNTPHRGDVIVFAAPPQALMGDSKKDFVKRLIGLPGDRLQVKEFDGVYINGERVQGPPEAAVPDYNWPADAMGELADPYTVPDGCYFVLGDNRNQSRDSHAWQNPVTQQPQPELEAGRVLGKAVVIFWPPQRIRLVSDNHDVRVSSNYSVVRDLTGRPAAAAP